MKFSMTGQEKSELLIQVTALIEVTAWPGLKVLFGFYDPSLVSYFLIVKKG